MSRWLGKGAFSLVEVTIALGIASFCLIGIFALLPTGLGANQESVRATHAASLAQAICSDLQSKPINGLSPIYELTPYSGMDGSTPIYLKQDGDKVTSAAVADFRLRLWITPPAATSPGPTWVRMVFSWPAAAEAPTNTFEMITAIRRDQS